jgi:hypothetical protein
MWDRIGVLVSELVQACLGTRHGFALWAGRAGHLRMRRLSDRYANLYGLPTQLALGAEPLASENHTMPNPIDDTSPLSEPDTAEQVSMQSGSNMPRPRPNFIPLNPNECFCLLGFRSDASASDLYDEAMMRQHFAHSLLSALGGTSNLNTLTRETLGGCIDGIRQLCGDSAGLYSAAWDRE